MTAGKGVVHSEMPEQKEGLVRGFQLWLNLPKSKKMIDPYYHDIQAKEIPVVNIDGGIVKVISGEFGGVSGPGKPHTGVKYLDVQKKKKVFFHYLSKSFGIVSSTYMKVLFDLVYL